ncbi:RsmD family RNA methyltransferase, partial [Candidatus Pelagibacter sp.]|nr:RsmD family RNA methyltransferase [Candidatus Pelagibacter sp.]
MRIISGKFKGKKITLPLDKSTRPLKDMVKESIFNLIKHSTKFGINLETSNILDLFSGIGSFGIECLSRGVKNVTFFENYPKVLPILKNNLAKLGDTSNYEIIEEEINNETKFYQLNKKFDL